MTQLYALVYGQKFCAKRSLLKQQDRVLSRCNHAGKSITFTRGRHDLEGDKHH